jgi:hypothetical protein
MKRTALALILLFSVLTIYSQEYTKENIRYVEVNGKAEKEFVPDQIYTKLVITEADTKGKKSLEKIEREFFKDLANAGIDPQKNITISDMQSDLEKFLLRKDNIAATREYIIMVTSSGQLAELFGILKQHELTDITVTHAKLSDPESAGRQLIKEAAENARKNAEAIAAGLGQQLGKAIYAQSYSGFQGQLFVNTASRSLKTQEMVAMDSSYELPDFRKIKLTHSVTVRFELE